MTTTTRRKQLGSLHTLVARLDELSLILRHAVMGVKTDEDLPVDERFEVDGAGLLLWIDRAEEDA